MNNRRHPNREFRSQSFTNYFSRTGFKDLAGFIPGLRNLLIDAATYRSWFTADETVNILDQYSPACANVGKTAIQWQ